MDLFKEIKKEDFEVKISKGIKDLMFNEKLLVLHRIQKEDMNLYKEIFIKYKEELLKDRQTDLNYTLTFNMSTCRADGEIDSFNVYMYYYDFVHSVFLVQTDYNNEYNRDMNNAIEIAKLAVASSLPWSQVNKLYKETLLGSNTK